MLRDIGNSGLSLLELLVAVSIISLLAGVTSQVLVTAVESWNYSRQQSEAMHNACWALDHILSKVRPSMRLLLPFKGSGPGYPSQVLAFSAMVDTDADGLIDEDPGADVTGDGAPGISGIDDDGDGDIDETTSSDDDEDGFRFFWWWQVNEDPMDGQDHDGDGYRDEDPGGDINDDGYSGVSGKDDNGNGQIDERNTGDDDEDGLIDEDPVEYWVYYLDPNSNLMERYCTGQAEILLEGVTIFQVTRIESGTISGVSLTLGVTTSNGEEVRIESQVYLKGIIH
ncbi:MAG: prepilin-type N-terminal cleavage/methylation domain-containing protein [bacterium]